MITTSVPDSIAGKPVIDLPNGPGISRLIISMIPIDPITIIIKIMIKYPFSLNGDGEKRDNTYTESETTPASVRGMISMFFLMNCNSG